MEDHNVPPPDRDEVIMIKFFYTPNGELRGLASDVLTRARWTVRDPLRLKALLKQRALARQAE